ncbi:alpha/beta fold hydrolase [Nocardia panacis]|uniref:Alpha/beta fold hydrolase n=1 Tax=Nocardia panacis TaxID=2340916 RepID=A0A3A4KK10_9NOCA|nr:alpha/beta hydrolase [Nocardia panacis]RJO73317.1 alpha/beta fold hydrolase [Nocardia panacis]
MSTPTPAHLRVPGATLYHEVRGSGPILLLLPGSGGDAAGFDPIADRLAEHYTVIATEARGYSRSTLDGPPTDQRIDVLADDALRLLENYTPAGESASVVGISGGAVVGLELLTRHPDRLRRLVAFEPPMFAALPDAARQRAMIEEVYQLFRTEGVAAAGARFLEAIGGTMTAPPDPATLPPRGREMLGRFLVNAPLMYEHELRRITGYRPDRAALSSAADRLVLAIGRDSRPHLPARPALTLAADLGLPVTEFPGGHSGMRDAPADFATTLLAALTTP